MDGSDEPEEDEVDGPGIPEEENAPRLTTEEVCRTTAIAGPARGL